MSKQTQQVDFSNPNNHKISSGTTNKPTEVKMNELIKEAAERLYPGIDRQVDRMLFIAGAKWYREQLILKLKEGQDE